MGQADKNLDGVLSYSETMLLLESIGVDLSLYPLWLRKWAFRRADYDQSNALDFVETIDTIYRFSPSTL